MGIASSPTGPANSLRSTVWASGPGTAELWGMPTPGSLQAGPYGGVSGACMSWGRGTVQITTGHCAHTLTGGPGLGLPAPNRPPRAAPRHGCPGRTASPEADLGSQPHSPLYRLGPLVSVGKEAHPHTLQGSTRNPFLGAGFGGCKLHCPASPPREAIGGSGHHPGGKSLFERPHGELLRAFLFFHH